MCSKRTSEKSLRSARSDMCGQRLPDEPGKRLLEYFHAAMRTSIILAIVVLLTLACAIVFARSLRPSAPQVLEVPTERHLRNMRQLTFGGQNAEAYFNGDGTRLIFQSQRDGGGCDQIYTMRTDGSDVHMVSTGLGRTTCSYYFPDGKRILYSSTHLGAPECPPKPDYSHGYVWPIYASYD